MSMIYQAVVFFLVALPAAAPSQGFKNIVIKPALSADPRIMRMQLLPNGDVKAKAVSVITLLSYGYDVPANPSPRLSSLPNWTIGERYDIDGKAPTTITALSQDTNAQSQAKQMIRRLLAERFKLVMRVESKRMSAYALTASNSGRKLHRSAITAKDCIFDTDPEGCHNFVIGFGHPLTAKAISMDDLAHYIENWTDLPVVNRTQLSGLFTVNTQGWLPMRLPPPPPGRTSAGPTSAAALSGVRLKDAKLRLAHLSGADLSGADLSGANLREADLSEAYLASAEFDDADLSWTWADLHGANLTGANLNSANLSDADLAGSTCGGTLWSNLDLKTVRGLETVRHQGPSPIDFRTLAQSGPLPLAFLRGCGLPNQLIAYLPCLFNEAIQFYSCFISYSTKDQRFADRLYADLQNNGVRCWFAPEDLKIGDKFRDRIDESIRIYDRLLIILSENSVQSPWVATEVEAAFERERRQGDSVVLFPIGVDDAVMSTSQAWASDIRRKRHVGDFSKWKDHDDYTKGLKRLLRDLKAEASES